MENLFPPEVAMRVPGMWRSLALVWAALFLFGLLSITKYEDKSTVIDSQPDNQLINLTETDKEEENAEESLQILTILRTP